MLVNLLSYKNNTLFAYLSPQTLKMLLQLEFLMKLSNFFLRNVFWGSLTDCNIDANSGLETKAEFWSILKSKKRFIK